MEFDLVSLALLGSIGTVALMSLRSSKGPDIHPLLLNSQSDVNRIRNQGESAVYRSKLTPHGGPLLACSDRAIRTLYDAFRQAGLKNGGQFLGTKGNAGYSYQTYETIAQRIDNFGSGLVNLTGIKTKSDSILGIYLQNCAEALIADLASHHYSLVSLAIPPAPTEAHANEHLTHILNDSELSIIVVSKATLPTVFSVAHSTKHLKAVIVVGTITKDDREAASGLGIKLWSFEEVEQNGISSPVEHVQPGPDDLAIICYTSGTTGKPKGVMLTHKNIMASVSSAVAIIPPNQKLSSSDRHLSYITLGHIYERIMIYHIIIASGQIAFYSGDVGKILEDAEAAMPTIFASIPKVLIRIQKHIEKIYGESFLYKYGLSAKEKLLEQGRLVNDDRWNYLAFRPIKKKFGGAVRLVIASGEPIDPTTLTFYRSVLGAQVLHAYGLTETTGAVTSTFFYDYSTTGTVGAPLPSNEIKLIDVPELGYRSEDIPNPRGEICVRGHNVMRGYWRDDNATRKVIDADGWFHTGDIGEVLAVGAFKIIDRKENLYLKSN